MRRRPKALRLFGRLVLASVAMNVLAILFYAPRIRADAIAHGTAKAGWFVAIVIVIVISTLFWWRIAVSAGNFARWLYASLMLTSLLQAPTVYHMSLRYGLPYGLMSGASFVLAMLSVAILFRRDVSRRLRSGGRVGEIDVSDFE